jgi:hypothetical protein
MEITYTLAGDYLLPNLKLSDPPDAPPIGKYGRMHKAYLREHRPILYSQLLLTERLYQICREIDVAAETRLRAIADREQAHEIILAELVYNSIVAQNLEIGQSLKSGLPYFPCLL